MSSRPVRSTEQLPGLLEETVSKDKTKQNKTKQTMSVCLAFRMQKLKKETHSLFLRSLAGGGWGFSSVVERLPRKRKALGSVPSSEKKNQKKKKKKKEV